MDGAIDAVRKRQTKARSGRHYQNAPPTRWPYGQPAKGLHSGLGGGTVESRGPRWEIGTVPDDGSGSSLWFRLHSRWLCPETHSRLLRLCGPASVEQDDIVPGNRRTSSVLRFHVDLGRDCLSIDHVLLPEALLYEMLQVRPEDTDGSHGGGLREGARLECGRTILPEPGRNHQPDVCRRATAPGAHDLPSRDLVQLLSNSFFAVSFVATIGPEYFGWIGHHLRHDSDYQKGGNVHWWLAKEVDDQQRQSCGYEYRSLGSHEGCQAPSLGRTLH
mmetsp:Transcript_25805/g.70902  ORF Transcript_25805/g.70902 Transcript_25805/m.70902 type:complete len:274 (-) Transcript_25805:542-1363(-)